MIFLGMIDANTILISISIALSAWALRTLHAVAVAQAAQKERSDENHERLVRIEDKVAAVENDVAMLKGQRT